MLSTTGWHRLRARASRGTVLIIVLGVLTILSVMGTAFSRFMRTELQASKYFELRKKAEQLAHDGIVLASAKLADFAAQRHYTSPLKADWPYEHDYATGRPNPYTPAAGGVPAKGFGMVPLRDSADVSFPEAAPPAPLTVGEISHYRPGDTSTLVADGDVLKLKVIECQSQINVRWLSHATFQTFRDALWDLGVQISLARCGNWFGQNPFLQDEDHVVNGEQVVTSLWAEIDSDAQINPPGNQSYADREFGSKQEFLDSLRNIHTNLNMPDTLWELAQDYITCTSWPLIDGYNSAPNQVVEVHDPDEDGEDTDYYWLRDGVQNNNANFPGLKEMYNLKRVAMPPINVNTASREVLMILFNRLKGEREYKDVQGRQWVVDPLYGMPDVVRPANTENGIGNDGKNRGDLLNVDAANDATLKWIEIGPFNSGNSTSILAHSNEILVDLLLKERDNRPFTSWNDFDMRFISRLDTKENGGFTGDQFGMPEGIAALPHPRIPWNDGAELPGVNNGALGKVGLIVGGVIKPQAFSTPDWDHFWYAACRDLIRAALQPAPKVTKFNPDEAYWQGIDTIDVTQRVAPVCFHSYGLYEVTSLAQLRGPVFNPQTGVYDIAPVVSSTVRAVVKVMDILRHHSQADFCTGFVASGTNPPSASLRSATNLTANGTITFPNSVDESRPIGLHQFNVGANHEARGAGVPPSKDFGYVQIRPEDRSPYQLSYYTDVLGYLRRITSGATAGTNFVQHFEASGLEVNVAPQGVFAAQNRNDFAAVPPTFDWGLGKMLDRLSTANNNAISPEGREGVAAFTDCYPDGIHLWGRGREPDLPEFGGQYSPRYKRYIAGAVDPFKENPEQEANLPYNRGTIEFWCKFQDDWYGTENSLRARTGPGPDKALPGKRNDAQRNSWHADNYFCGLFGGTTFRYRDDRAVGVQMFIYKDVGMQLKIVRMLFAQAFEGNIDPVTGNIDQVNDLGDLAAEMKEDNPDWDFFERDAAGNAADPNDLGILYARVDAIVFLDALPFPILPHHWYHFSIAYDSNDAPNNPHPAGEYQSSPFNVAINGFQCRYAQEMVVPDGPLAAGLNDHHTFFQGADAKIAHASVRLNELNPEDRITIGCIERLMLPSSWYAANGINPQLFQFAQNDPAGGDKDKPFRLVAPAEATIDNLRISSGKVSQNLWNYATMTPTGPVLQYARYNQAVNYAYDPNWFSPTQYSNPTLNPNFANSVMTDGPGIFYENGWVNPYNQAVRPAWIAWQEWRPRFDPNRHLGPAGPGPGRPHLTLGGNPNLANYEPPRSNIAPFESDYVQIFAGPGKSRVNNAWTQVSGADKLDSELFHTKPEFTNDPYLRALPTNGSMRHDNREFDPVKKLFIPADGLKDNVTWYGGMEWPKNTVVPVGGTIMYRAYFRRGEATVASPANATPVLDEVVVGLATPPRFLEYVLVD